jgi:hypothetical protein
VDRLDVDLDLALEPREQLGVRLGAGRELRSDRLVVGRHRPEPHRQDRSGRGQRLEDPLVGLDVAPLRAEALRRVAHDRGEAIVAHEAQRWLPLSHPGQAVHRQWV